MSELKCPTAPRWDLDYAFRVAGLHSPFPRGISFADVDSETEINGHFLVVEGKRWGEKLSRGQSYTMNARSRDGRTCLIIYGSPPAEVSGVQFWGEPMFVAGLSDLWSIITAWANWADKQPRPPARPQKFLTDWRDQALSRLSGPPLVT